MVWLISTILEQAKTDRKAHKKTPDQQCLYPHSGIPTQNKLNREQL